MLQQAEPSGGESDSASVGTPTSRSAASAAIACNFLAIWPMLIVNRVPRIHAIPIPQLWLCHLVFVPCNLTLEDSPSNMLCMAYSFLVFDFGGNEEVAQVARHKVDGWKQGFRLGKKIEIKFDRLEPEAGAESIAEAPPEPPKEVPKAKSKSKATSKASGNSGKASGPKSEMQSDIPPAEIRLIVRLDFSDHEKLSKQRWLDRISGEEPFKSAKSSVVRSGDSDFRKISDLFQSLN